MAYPRGARSIHRLYKTLGYLWPTERGNETQDNNAVTGKVKFIATETWFLVIRILDKTNLSGTTPNNS